MPLLDIRYQKRTTRIENMKQISKSLGRKSEYIMKWFAKELSTHVKLEPIGAMIISGTHDKGHIRQCLDKFIDLLVLCIKCGNPETIIESNHDNICLNCKACGCMNKIKVDRHSLIAYIHKQIRVKKLPIFEHQCCDDADDNDDDDWSCDTSDDAVRARQQEFLETSHKHEGTENKVEDGLLLSTNESDDDFITFSPVDTCSNIDKELDDFIDNI
jgi:translation initiation factor 2 beta subunit (eIF-2beta)/eIF-5